MDLQKTVKFAEDYFSDYFWNFYASLRKPGERFPSDLGPSAGSTHLVFPSGGPVPGEGRLNPRLLSFALISILVGYSLLSVTITPLRDVGDSSLWAVVAIIVTYWVFFACITHVACKLMRGKGSFVQTISVVIQLLAVLYVVGGTFQLLAHVTAKFAGTHLSWYWRGVFGNLPDEVIVYTLVHDILFAIYLPLALMGIHRFGWVRQIALGLITLIGVFLKTAAYSVLSVLE